MFKDIFPDKLNRLVLRQPSTPAPAPTQAQKGREIGGLLDQITGLKGEKAEQVTKRDKAVDELYKRIKKDPDSVDAKLLENLDQKVMKHVKIKLAVLGHPRVSAKTKTDILGKLTVKESSWMAKNKDTPSAVLEELAKDPEPKVRMDVAGNMATSRGVLAELINDKDRAVQIYARAVFNAREQVKREQYRRGRETS